jgi:hypothetical protein
MPNTLMYYGMPSRCGEFVGEIMSLGGVITAITDHGDRNGYTTIEFVGEYDAVRERYKDEGNLHVASGAAGNRDELRKIAWVCVLSDGSTYTGLDGCWIARTTPEQVKRLDAGDPVNDLPEYQRYSLQTVLEWAIDHGGFDEEE